MIVICQNGFPIGVLPGATEEQAEAFIKKVRADSDAAITDPRQVRPAFSWRDVPVMQPAAEGARGEVKVGDRVRAIRDGSSYYRKGDCGTVVSIDRDGDFWVRWDNPIVPDAGYGWFIYQHNCERVTQQPAADCTCPHQDAREPDHDVACPARLAQQPAAVDEAMVDRACDAYVQIADDCMGLVRRKAMRAALTAALATQQQGGAE